MDYARFRATGYLIGMQRLKRAGGRWMEKGAHYTAKARAAWLSHRWSDITALDQHLAQAT